MMSYPYSLMLVRRAAVTATLFALIVMLMVPTRALAMELKIIGNQLILSGSVVGDEPGKVREALVSSPDIDTVILRNSRGGNAPAGGIVHIFFLIGFRNRMAVFLNWVWAWLTYGRGARLITADTTPLALKLDHADL